MGHIGPIRKVEDLRKKAELAGQYLPEPTFTGPTKEETSKDIVGEVRATLGEPAKESRVSNGVEN